jgi:hypothetical protein
MGEREGGMAGRICEGKEGREGIAEGGERLLLTIIEVI